MRKPFRRNAGGKRTVTVYCSAEPGDVPFFPDEAVRYAGGKKSDIPLKKMIEECQAELWPQLCFRAAVADYNVNKLENGYIDLEFAKVKSDDLSRRLEGSERVILFAATAGLAVDTFVRRLAVTSPAKALCADAVGSAAIEAYCDMLESRLTVGKIAAKSRFSPGYGDLSLALHQNIDSALQLRRIGISVTKAGLLVPSKSVTAIIGYRDVNSD